MIYNNNNNKMLYSLLYIIIITESVWSNQKTRWLPHLQHTDSGIIDIPDHDSNNEGIHSQQTLRRMYEEQIKNLNNNNENEKRRLTGNNVLSNDDKQAILDAHNKYRYITAGGNTAGQPSATNMNEMFWDAGLAKVSEDYSRNCKFEHNANRLSSFKLLEDMSSFTFGSSMSVGENLYLTTRAESLDTLLKGLEAFYAEYQYFTHSTIGCVTGQ